MTFFDGLLMGILAGLGSTVVVGLRFLREGEARGDAQVKVVQQQYERVIAGLVSAFEAVSLTNQYGGVPMKEARVEAREPTPEERVGRMVDEQTLARGMDSLRAQYRAINITVTEDELRDEVMGLMTGAPWSPPAALQELTPR